MCSLSSCCWQAEEELVSGNWHQDNLWNLGACFPSTPKWEGGIRGRAQNMEFAIEIMAFGSKEHSPIYREYYKAHRRKPQGILQITCTVPTKSTAASKI